VRYVGRLRGNCRRRWSRSGALQRLYLGRQGYQLVHNDLQLLLLLCDCPVEGFKILLALLLSCEEIWKYFPVVSGHFLH
jgi:hypothetical protein